MFLQVYKFQCWTISKLEKTNRAISFFLQKQIWNGGEEETGGSGGKTRTVQQGEKVGQT